jgi:putative endonuclease
MGDLKKLGPAGEEYAWGLLKKRGDTLVSRNFTCPLGELDLVTWHGETLVFTEVRARSSLQFGTPAETVTASKQKKVRRAAEWFLMKRLKARTPPSCRFDVIWIVANKGEIAESGIIVGAF